MHRTPNTNKGLRSRTSNAKSVNPLDKRRTKRAADRVRKRISLLTESKASLLAIVFDPILTSTLIRDIGLHGQLEICLLSLSFFPIIL